MGDDGGRPDERPEHEVYVSALHMAMLPVTNAQYRAYTASTGSPISRFLDEPGFDADDQPVVGVTWDEAAAYCAWLCGVTGQPWRLPTEAEREKAMRGGRARERYPWGDGDGAGDGRFEQASTWAVGRSEPNGYGLLDIAYNIHEWCSDWYDAGYYSRSPWEDPQGPATGTRRASRGGAWRHQVKVCRNAARSSLPPSFQYNDYGFRVVRPG